MNTQSLEILKESRIETETNLSCPCISLSTCAFLARQRFHVEREFKIGTNGQFYHRSPSSLRFLYRGILSAPMSGVKPFEIARARETPTAERAFIARKSVASVRAIFRSSFLFRTKVIVAARAAFKEKEKKVREIRYILHRGRYIRLP